MRAAPPQRLRLPGHLPAAALPGDGCAGPGVGWACAGPRMADRSHRALAQHPASAQTARHTLGPRPRSAHPAEYCSRGSLYDVLRAAAQQPDKAAELTWQRRLGMVRLAAAAATAGHGCTVVPEWAGLVQVAAATGHACHSADPSAAPRRPPTRRPGRRWAPRAACTTCTPTTRPSSTATSRWGGVRGALLRAGLSRVQGLARPPSPHPPLLQSPNFLIDYGWRAKVAECVVRLARVLGLWPPAAAAAPPALPPTPLLPASFNLSKILAAAPVGSSTAGGANNPTWLVSRLGPGGCRGVRHRRGRRRHRQRRAAGQKGCAALPGRSAAGFHGASGRSAAPPQPCPGIIHLRRRPRCCAATGTLPPATSTRLPWWVGRRPAWAALSACGLLSGQRCAGAVTRPAPAILPPTPPPGHPPHHRCCGSC